MGGALPFGFESPALAGRCDVISLLREEPLSSTGFHWRGTGYFGRE